MKKYLCAVFYMFFFICAAAMGNERPWPDMAYKDKSGRNYQLVSLTEVKEEPFVEFATTLFSTPKVYELYENGQPYDKERSQRLWNRVVPRTQEWFKGNDTFVPWTAIKFMESGNLIGILGAHLHTNKAQKEYKGVEFCYAIYPEFNGQSVISNAFKVYAQAFSSQLYGLGEEFNRFLAPISPLNFPSLRLVFSLGFEIGKSPTVDQPYISGYFPNYVKEVETPQLLDLAEKVVTTLRNKKDVSDLTPNSFEPSIRQEDWEKLKAVRVVAIMPQSAFFDKFK